MNFIGWASKLAAAGVLTVVLFVMHPRPVSNKPSKQLSEEAEDQSQRDSLANVDHRISELEALHIESHLAVMESKQDSDDKLLRGIALAIILMALKDTWGFAVKKRRTEDSCTRPSCNNRKEN